MKRMKEKDRKVKAAISNARASISSQPASIYNTSFIKIIIASSAPSSIFVPDVVWKQINPTTFGVGATSVRPISGNRVLLSCPNKTHAGKIQNDSGALAAEVAERDPTLTIKSVSTEVDPAHLLSAIYHQNIDLITPHHKTLQEDTQKLS